MLPVGPQWLFMVSGLKSGSVTGVSGGSTVGPSGVTGSDHHVRGVPL